MVTISNIVKDIINRQTFIQESINHNIVSFNKLARYLKPKIEEEMKKEVKTSAIVMALRRQADKLEKTIITPKFSYYIGTIKTDICYIMLEESPALLNKIQQLYPIIDFKKGGILNITQGNFEIGIITNKKYKDQFLDVLSDEKILDVIDGLVSISLTYSKEFVFTPGVLYDVVRFLAWENINITSIILTSTEMSIIIDQKDLMRCYKTLSFFAEDENKETTSSKKK
jgi:aspartokinase